MPRKPKYEEFYIHEILQGKKGTEFMGILSVIRKYMHLK